MESSNLLAEVASYAEKFMEKYDSSHDFNHIKRVLALSHQIVDSSPAFGVDPYQYRKDYVTLAALLHDVGDRKYRKQGEDTTHVVENLLLSFKAPPQMAADIQQIVTHVSYTTEIKDPEKVLEVIKEYPELAVVQDADRIDALGAIGIGRAFTFGGARKLSGSEQSSMQQAIEHFTEKLERLEGMMKTAAGKKIAEERTARLRVFRGWWEEEAAIGNREL